MEDIDTNESHLKDPITVAVIDDGVNNCHPALRARFKVKQIFRIGAATADGRVWGMAGDLANMDFILPGHNVFDAVGSYNGLLENFKPRTGSSVATALAAGQAALIMHCVRLAAIHSTKNVRTKLAMKAALKRIGTSDEEQHKFIEVWNRFDSATEKLRGASMNEMLNYLAYTLGPALVPPGGH
ncbi:hypothetical protein TrVFT333_002814 [Trichoderma virens FT-333]|nr:hypothetical protein TrVFT333_002814 [Trichoderma virens FT-333]